MEVQIDRLLKNYSNARLSWEAWCFMIHYNLDSNQLETLLYIKNNQLLSYLCYLTWKDFHIEFYKIVKQSNKNPDNIYALLVKYGNQKPKNIDQVNLALKKLEERKQNFIDLCNVRDKFFAHLDQDYEDYKYTSPPLPMILDCFIAVEEGIIALTSRETLQKLLDELPSRNDFKFKNDS